MINDRTKVTRNRKPDRSDVQAKGTIEGLQYYVPIFQKGDQAFVSLEQGSFSNSSERNRAINMANVRSFVVDRIAEMYGPLLTKETYRIVKAAHMPADESLFDVVYYAGIDGLIKGLRRFEIDKINVSSTNYLIQWFITYAKKELSSLEAPLGVAPSRYQKYRKVSAVRKKIAENLGREATDEEVYDFFQSGQADIKSLAGPLNQTGPSKANQSIDLDFIREEATFSRESNVTVIDPMDAQNENRINTTSSSFVLFEETLFGVFISKYNFTDIAKAVLISDLGYSNPDLDFMKILDNITQSEYRALSARWKDLIRDVNGPFYTFLKENEGSGNTDINVQGLISNIISYDKPIKAERYVSLFKNKRVELV